MNSTKFTLKLRDEEKIYMKLKLFNYSDVESTYVNKSEFLELRDLKNKIFNSNNWDKHKKFSNDYELIHIPNKRNKTDSIALYQPLSRSYFKMIEIINEFNLINSQEKNLNSAHLAEGPGGFMEATYNICKKYNIDNRRHFGITLYSKNKDIPGWNKAYDFLSKNNKVNISYGADNTGDLYKKKNIKHFINFVGKGTCSLVTGDGGFDFSIDFNKQEQLSYKLILCEIITNLYIQKINGSFICKFFDIYTLETIKLLYFLCCFYDNVYINKPLTSRPANSEKYIICKGFRGIDYEYLDEILENIHYDIIDIFDYNIPNSFIEQIKMFNNENTKCQINTIKYTLELIDKKKNLSLLNEIIKKQVLKAKEWCQNYNVNINYKSNFIVKYN